MKHFHSSTSIFLGLALLFLGSGNSLAQELITVVQRGHAASVNSVVFSHSGKWIATGSSDKTLKLWEVETGRELRTFNGHMAAINHVIFSSNDEELISASADGNIYFWDVLTGKIIKTYRQENENVLRLALSPDDAILAVAGTGDSVRVYNTNSNNVLYSVKGSRMARDNVFISTDGNDLLTGLDNRKALVYDLKTGEFKKEYAPKTGFCGGCSTQAITTPDGKIIIGARNIGLKLYKDTTIIYSFSNDLEENISTLKTNTSGSQMVTVTEDSVSVWDVNNGRWAFSLNPHTKDKEPLYGFDLTYKQPNRRSNHFTDADFSPNGRYLVTADNTNLVILWDAQTGERISSFYGYLSFPADDGLHLDPNSYWERFTSRILAYKNKVQLSPDGTYAYRAKIGYEVRKWELSTGQIVQRYGGHSKVVVDFALSKDGSRLLTGSADRTAHLYDATTGKIIKSFVGHRDIIWSVNFSHDETKVLTSSSDGTVKIWDVESGSLLNTLVLSRDPTKVVTGYTVKFMPNDLYLMVATTNGTLQRWEIDTGTKVQELIGHIDMSPDFEYVPASNNLISVGWDHSVRLWDVSSGFQQKKFVGHNEAVQAIAFSANNSWMATGGSDRIAILWDRITGKMLKKFVGHQSIITSVLFSPDSKYLITGSIDGITKIWDVATGKEIITHFVIGNNDWLVTNSKGYFNGTDGAQKQVFFVKGNESFSLDQFYQKYFSPNLLQQSFGSVNKQNGLLEQLKKYPPPVVKIEFPEYGQVQAKAPLSVLVKITNTGGGIKSVSLFHNSKLIETRKKELLAKVALGKSIIQKFSVNLIPGTNQIKVIAQNNTNYGSKPDAITVTYKTPTKQNVLYVMAVGINTYKNPSLNLNYAKNDAKAFVSLIKEKSKSLFDKVETHELYDGEATQANILGVLDLLSNKIKPGDVFYFYYAGHGSLVDENYYFVPTDNTRLYSKEKLEREAISAEIMQNKFQNISALKQLVIIDACQSGSSAELLAQRGSMEEKAMAQLSRSTGIHVLSAAGSKQFATEFKELGHGVFTFALLEALDGKADGAPKDGSVTIYELKGYIDSLVPEYSQRFKGKTQYPYTFSRGQDFPVTIVK